MLLAQANGDRHPDAHACRLHVSLHAMHTPLSAHLPWDASRELRAYVMKRNHVSLSCRLEVSQELLLLTRIGSTGEGDGPAPGVPHTLRNRRLLLEAATTRTASGSSGGDVTVELPCPEPVAGPQFDAVLDRSCVDEGVLADLGAFLGRMSTISYSRPETLTGLAALIALDKWLTHGLGLTGGRDEKGFLFLYELMRLDLHFKVLSSDSGHALGALLLRMLPPAEAQKPGFLMSVLRCMMHNRQLTRHLPRFEDDRKVKLSVMFRGQEVLTKLMEKVTAVMREHEHAGKLVWPQHKFASFQATSTITVHHQLRDYLGDFHAGKREPPKLPTHLRPWLTLRPGEAALQRSISQSGDMASTEVLAFAQAPLAPIGFGHLICTTTRLQRELPKLPIRLPFDLSKHPSVQSELAQTMLKRLQEDMANHAELENAAALPQLVGFSKGQLAACVGSDAHTNALLERAKAIDSALTTLQARDTTRYASLASRAVDQANGLPAAAGREGVAADAERRAAFGLARLAGREPSVTFDQLVGLLLSQRAEMDLQLFNPFATERQVQSALS